MPVIGIGAWGTINGRELLETTRGGSVNYVADGANIDGARNRT